MSREPLLLIGGGGHCRSCIDVIESEERYEIIGILDAPQRVGGDVLGYPITGTDDDIARLASTPVSFLITVGQVRTPDTRIRLFNLLLRNGVRLATVVSAVARVSRHARIGEGTIVMHHAVVNAGAVVGRNCILNTKSLIEHDAEVEDHSHISTGAIVNGGVHVGAGTFFGSNATCKHGIRIPDGSFVRAHELVTGQREGDR